MNRTCAARDGVAGGPSCFQAERANIGKSIEETGLMANVYVEARPKRMPEGSSITR
jgi:hypothetical protein